MYFGFEYILNTFVSGKILFQMNFYISQYYIVWDLLFLGFDFGFCVTPECSQGHFWLTAWGSLLMLLEGPYGVLGFKLGPPAWKACVFFEWSLWSLYWVLKIQLTKDVCKVSFSWQLVLNLDFLTPFGKCYLIDF